MPRTFRRRARAVRRRLDGWPRRVAAVLCLVAAALTALATPTREDRAAASSSAQRRHPPRGVRAMPIEIDAALAATLTRGQRIDVLASPTDDGSPTDAAPVLVVRGVRVLSIRAPTNGISSAAAVIVVAVDPEQALRLARYARAVLLVEIARYFDR